MTQTPVDYAAMSKADLIGVIETQKTVIQQFQRLLPLPNKVLAPGEKLAWAIAKPLIDKEKPNERGLVRIPIDEIAEQIGMSGSSASRYISNICERFEATHETAEYTTKKGQKCNLTYVDPSDPLWTTHPADLPLPEERERVINGNECPRCRSTGTYHLTRRPLTHQEIGNCDACNLHTVSNIIVDNDPLDPMCTLVHKKGSPAWGPFEEEQETEKARQPGDLLEKAQTSASLSVDTACSMPPAWLRDKKIWCPWRYGTKVNKKGKRDKIPYNANPEANNAKAETDNPSTWATFDQAQAIYEQSQSWALPYDGIGLMCDASFVGIDLDNCWDNETGAWSDWALEIVARFASYTYVTPNRGLRIVILAKKPGPRCKKGDIEIYEEGRFFTWRGEQLADTPDTIEKCQAALEAFYWEVWPEEPAAKLAIVANIPCSTPAEKILEKARGAANCAKFIRLYDKGDITGYPSESEADLALCEMLSYWGAMGDVFTIDALFRQSRLMRDKWDEPARAGETYGHGTILRAIAMAMGEQLAS